MFPGTLRRTDYQGGWLFYTSGGESRRDMARNLRLDLCHRGFTIAGFTLVHERRTSNLQP